MPLAVCEIVAMEPRVRKSRAMGSQARKPAASAPQDVDLQGAAPRDIDPQGIAPRAHVGVEAGLVTSNLHRAREIIAAARVAAEMLSRFGYRCSVWRGSDQHTLRIAWDAASRP